MKKNMSPEKMIRATPNIPENRFVPEEEEWISADVFKEAEKEGLDIDK